MEADFGSLLKAISVLSAVAVGLGTLWAFFTEIRNKIEAPWIKRLADSDAKWLARVRELEAEVRRCMEGRIDDALTEAWNGQERRLRDK